MIRPVLEGDSPGSVPEGYRAAVGQVGELFGEGIHCQSLMARDLCPVQGLRPGGEEQQASVGTERELVSLGLETLFEPFVAEDDQVPSGVDGFVADQFLVFAYEGGDENTAVGGAPKPTLFVSPAGVGSVGAVYDDVHLVEVPQEEDVPVGGEFHLTDQQVVVALEEIRPGVFDEEPPRVIGDVGVEGCELSFP